MEVELFKSINDLLEHIKEVQEDVINMTKDSYMTFSEIFAQHQQSLPDRALETLQYQDIISQQLNATVDAIKSVQKNIDFFTHSSKEDSIMLQKNLKKLSKKLDEATEAARAKKDAFSGKVGHEDETDIEFF